VISVAVRCPHFGPCGGCTSQHVPYREQLRLKTALVERLVRAAVPGAPPVAPMLPSTPLDDPWAYRHKVHFVVGGGAMGHYRRGSRRIVPVRECPVHDPRGNALAFAFRDAFARGGGDAVRGLVVRVGCHTGELMATLVVSREPDRALRAATERALRAAPEPPSSFHLNVHPKDDGFIFGPRTRRIAGSARMREEVLGISFLISPAAFFQTNVRAAELLVGLVLEAVPRGAGVLDLYAGAGLFALPLARRGATVTAIEENREAVEDGEASLRFNRIPSERCRFVAKPVEAALRSVRAADAVVLDPPRDGCARGVIDEICGRLRPAMVAYVSCNPEALARDLGAAARHGYAVRSVQPVDMFPHTPHVEAVAVLTRAGA
jgi:23S rRNA (uracil-5-)-methyltransferase RumA